MAHGTVRMVHYGEISAGGSDTGRTAGAPALSYPFMGEDVGEKCGILQSGYRKSQSGVTAVWRCAIYLRISREDDEAELESNSISNQRALLMEYIAGRENFCFAGEWVDDGYSGSHFERPALQQMLQAAVNRQIDCILVKDLSRFGREYIQTGWYIKRWFPEQGIRFIAVADHYDSANALYSEKTLLLPILNLMNDAYCRDISRKVRHSQDARRRQGDYMGAFAPYGYQKSTEDKHKLVADPQTADVVRKIFLWKSKGYSAEKISAFLNLLEIPSPYVYKQISGQSYVSGFVDRKPSKKNYDKSEFVDRKHPQQYYVLSEFVDRKSSEQNCTMSDIADRTIPAQKNKIRRWSPVAVRRILRNQLYIGILQQGKTKKVNYKLQKRETIPQKDWICVHGVVPSLVEESLFLKCQRQ